MKTNTKDLIQYHFPCMDAFYTFLKDDNISELTNKLIRIENHYRYINELPNDKKGLWFRFYSGYMEATSISDIVHTFVNGTQPDKDFYKECMLTCCNLAQIEVYYS